MKRILSILLVVLMLASSVPITGFALEKPSAGTQTVEIVENSKEEIDYEKTLFSPLTVCGNRVVQSGEEVESFQKNGETFVEASAFAGAASFSSSIDIIEKDGEEFASLDDLYEQKAFKKEKINEKTVYSKPFQTKRLIVYGKEIPNVNETEREQLFDGGTVLSFESEDITEAAFEKLKNNSCISSVEYENIYSTADFSEKDFPLGENLSWGADYVFSPYLVEYENKYYSEQTVTVAVVDTGINQSHSFLKNRIDERSKSFVESEATVEDGNGHGSHVAGIITDNTPNNVKILALKALDSDGFGSDIDIANAINYATEQGANIISMSFGGYDLFTASVLKSAIFRAYKAGVTLVAAAGNESSDASYYYPANSDYCITVAAIKSDGSPAGYSNFGNDVDVAAPGSNINSTVNKTGSTSDTYEHYSGTSMATPFVSAACADIVLLNKVKSPDELKSFIKSNVSNINYQGKNNYGSGVINMLRYPDLNICRGVIFDVLSGYYTDELSVSLYSPQDGARIYYTLDGSTPDESSIPYTEPIALSENTQVKAIAFCDDFEKSVITKASYRFSHYDFESNYIIDGNGYIISYLGTAEDLVVQDEIAGRKIIGVGDSVFIKNEKLKSIVLPDSVEQLGNSAFNQTKNLKDIVARGVKYVGDYCFYSDTWSNITLGSLESVGKYAFFNCRVSDESFDISNLKEVEDYSFYKCKFNEVKSSAVTKVGKYAFYSNWGLISVDLPNVETIDANAFSFCEKIEIAKLDSVTQIGSSAFDQSNGELKTVVCPNLRIIGSLAFDGCHKLESIDLENVTQLYTQAFNRTLIKSVNMPKLQKIQGGAFYGMRVLEEVNIPKLSKIPSSMFEECKSLKTIPDCVKDVTEIGFAAFRNAGIEELDFLNAVSVDDEAFSFCEKAKSLHLPNCTEMGWQRNLGSSELTQISLPDAISVEGIESSPNIISISLPRVISVSGNGFRHDYNLKSVYMPNLKNADRGYLFYDCKALEEVNLPNLQSAGANSFKQCYSLKEIYLPICTYIGQSCFEDCRELEIIDLSSLKTIDVSYSPFKKCPKLKHLILNNLESFSYAWFYKCDSLKELTLPKLKSIKFEDGFFDYGDSGPQRVDVNMHTPVLETMMLQHDNYDTSELYHNAYALPSTMTRIYPSSTGEWNTPALEFYGFTDFNIDSRIIYNAHDSPCIFEDLPSEANIESDGESISIRAYCADPVYTWYYSENGSDFKVLPVPSSNALLPNKSGYYYCRVKERTTDNYQNSSVCSVAVQNESELVALTLSFGEANNLFAGEVLYQNLEAKSTVYLPEGVDIKLLYNGTFETVYENGNALYQEPNTFDFTLQGETELTRKEEKLIKNCTITNNLKNNTATYTGERIEPVYTLTYKGEVLTQGIDYLISFANNLNANSNAIVMLEGIGEFSGTAYQAFHIDMINLDKCSISIAGQEYTGSYLTPTPRITLNGRDITSGYSLEYYDNKNIGTAYCWIEGDEKTVTGYREVSFRIGISIKNAEITLDKYEYEYTGGAIRPEPTVRIGSNLLTKNKDYVLSWENFVQLGTATVSISGIGRYINKVDLNYSIGTHVHSFDRVESDDNQHWYVCFCGETSEKESHTMVQASLVEATCTQSGEAEYACSICGATCKEELSALGHITASPVKENVVKATYTKNGSYDSVVYCERCGSELSRKKGTTAKLEKKANTLSVKGKTATVKYSKLKKSNQSISKDKALTVSKAQGKVTFSKTSGNKKITINKTSGKITVKKGLKKGSYKVKIKVSAAGNSTYKEGSKTVTVTIKIK